MFNFRFRLNCDFYPHPIYNVSFKFKLSLKKCQLLNTDRLTFNPLCTMPPAREFNPMKT